MGERWGPPIFRSGFAHYQRMLRLRQMLFPALFKPRLHGLALERFHLVKQIQRTEDTMQRMARDFWSRGGICCPGCGVPGYSELSNKQDRRRARLGQIDKKLATHAKPSARA